MSIYYFNFTRCLEDMKTAGLQDMVPFFIVANGRVVSVHVLIQDSFGENILSFGENDPSFFFFFFSNRIINLKKKKKSERKTSVFTTVSQVSPLQLCACGRQRRQGMTEEE